MTSNPSNNRLSYKHFHGSFKKDTIDYHVGRNSLEPWDKESVIEYCIENVEHIVDNDGYTDVFAISKRFLKFFDCSCQSEFEEKILNPILRKLCVKYEEDFEQVQKKIVENDCVSYEENFK